MRPSSFIFAFVFLWVVHLAIAAHGQNSNNVSGRVVDGNGASVKGALVILTRPDVLFRAELTTDDGGRFSFQGIRNGRYTLIVRAATFASKEITVVASEQRHIEIILQPEPLAFEVAITSTYLAGSRESLSEIPGSLERIDKHTLNASRVFNFSEALRKVTGIHVRDEEGFGLRPNIGIRGTNPTRSTKVLLLEDGIPLAYAPYGDNASYYHPPIERFESVEVLKGAGQIAYGPQTVAGLINYLTPNPTEKPTFGLRLTGGDRSYFNGSFNGSGTIGRTGIIGSLTRKQGNGARENINSKLNDVSTKVVHSLDDRNSLTFKLSYYGEDSNVTYSGLTEAEFAVDPRGNAFRNDFYYGDRIGVSASHTSVITPGAVVTTNFYANTFSRDWWRQSSNSGQRPNRLNIDPDCLSMADLNTTCGNEGRLRKYETYGIEPKFSLNYDSGNLFRGELLTGVRYHWETQRRRQENGDVPHSRSGAASEINIRKNEALSGFVQNRFIVGRLAITPGIRYERIDIARRNLLTTPISEGNTTVTEVIPGIGAAYSGIPGTTLFVGLHRGFSPPRAEDIIGNNGSVVELDAERSWNYEVGARTNFARGVRIEATFFRLDHENQIVPASLAGGVGATLTNGGRTLQQGFEFMGQADTGTVFRSKHNFYIRTAATWLPLAKFQGLRYSSITTPATLDLFCPSDKRISITQCTITGNRLPYVPETLLTTSVGYSHTDGFNGSVENVLIGRQFGDDLNSPGVVPNGQIGKIAKQSYWNATANYKVEKWKTAFFVTVKNVFDRTFIVDRVRGILPSSPRLVQAGVNVNF
ncbi:MAG TPA: TonB-dependent receptor plug domain-containing protein [Pyrinomonadaceae bacterium]|nr:TonB-dependent receptor plug domain-containing protein [Pyrinomonadaceae bacterium]